MSLKTKYSLSLIAITGLSMLSIAEGTITDKEASYSLGVMLGIDHRYKYDNLHTEQFLDGLKEAYINHNLDHEDRKAASDLLVDYYYQNLERKSDIALEEGLRYQEANARRNSVKVASSGLQYEVLQRSNGKPANLNDSVSLHYLARLVDGTPILNSYESNSPKKTTLNGKNLIPGLVEGLQMMTVGSKYRFVIPAELAYGEQGGGHLVAPNSTLLYEVELLAVE